MKNRPQLWSDLPYCLRERLAENCNLKYDGYESSRAEALSDLMNGIDYRDNEKIVQNYYSELKDEDLSYHVRSQLNSLKSQSEELEKLLNEN